jgi:hypothetical protein
MAQGNYDHPSYLTRQAIGITSAAGANGTSGYKSFISDMRIRKGAWTVRTVGTSSGAGAEAMLLVIGTYVSGFGTGGGFGTNLTTSTGTNTVGTIGTLGSSVVGIAGTSTDFNIRLTAGSVMAIKQGTDASSVVDVTFEMYIDSEGQWTGPNN